MAFPFHEEPISEAEEALIRKVSGDLYDLCEKSRGTPDEDRVSEEHDAMMRLRRRNEQVEESHKDLLAALAEATLALDGLAKGEGVTKPIEQTIRAARSAIAKAEGK